MPFAATRALFAGLVYGLMAIFAPPLQAACPWNANLTFAPHGTRSSAAFALTWSAAPLSCGTFTRAGYRIVLKEGGYPTSPTDGLTFNAGSGSIGRDAHVLRAQREFYPKIYACDDAACTDVLGDAEDAPTNTTAAADSTEQEVWVVSSVTSTSTTVYAQSGHGAPSTFFYPAGWTRAGKLAFYWEDSGTGDIKMKYATTAGWQDFNTASWESALTVAQSQPGYIDFDSVGHAYVFPVTDGTNDFVRLMAQNHPGGGFPDDHIVSVDSTNDLGNNFGLYCASCCAGSTSGECDWNGNGVVAVCANGDYGQCYNVDSALHGRWMWDYLAYGVPDVTADAPMIVFSGEADDESGDADECDAALLDNVADDDILLATLDPFSGDWEVEMDGTCPEGLIGDFHDPGVTPLPDNAFKIYVKGWNNGVVRAYYHSGGSIEAAYFTPSFELSDSTPIDNACIANIDSFAVVDVNGPHEGMFFDGGATADYDGFEDGCVNRFNTGATYFAELTN